MGKPFFQPTHKPLSLPIYPVGVIVTDMFVTLMWIPPPIFSSPDLLTFRMTTKLLDERARRHHERLLVGWSTVDIGMIEQQHQEPIAA